jgi:hypothetical protein
MLDAILKIIVWGTLGIGLLIALMGVVYTAPWWVTVWLVIFFGAMEYGIYKELL